MARKTRNCTQPHGTVARYWAGCSCVPCCDALNAYKHTRRPTVDGDVARARITELMEGGMSMHAIALSSGKSRHTLLLIMRGRRKVQADTMSALRMVTGRPFDAAVLVSAKRPRMLAEAMRDAGYTRRQIADAGGIRMSEPAELLRARAKERERCLASTAAGIERAATVLMTGMVV